MPCGSSRTCARPEARGSTLAAAAGVESSSVVARRCCAARTTCFTRSFNGLTRASAPGPDGAQSE